MSYQTMPLLVLQCPGNICDERVTSPSPAWPRKVNTKVVLSICSCLVWRVAVQATLQNAGSGIFKGETSTQFNTHMHARTHTYTCTSNKEFDVNNKFHSYSLMLWLSPPLVLTIPWKLSLFLTTALTCSPRKDSHQQTSFFVLHYF